MLARTLGGLLFLLGLCHGAAAQDLRYLRHQSWSTEEGLPQDSVHGIVQTADGFLWIATEGGVARFDGISFKVFDHSHESAMMSDDACCLASDAKGRLWVGTADGLLRLEGQHFVRFGEKDGLPSPSIRALRIEPGGSLVAVTSAGAARWNGDHFTASPQAPSGAATEGEVRVSGKSGALWSFSNTTVTLAGGSADRQWKTGAGLPGSRVETLFVDRDGHAWVGTNDGLAVLGENSAAAIPVSPLAGNVVLQVYEDREGNEWIGTETSGLHVLRSAKFRTEPKLVDQAVTALVQSGNDAVWVGTRRDGLRLLRGEVSSVPAPPERLTSPFILSLAPGANGSVWAGTPDGLNHVDRNGKTQKITSAEGLPDDYIQALADDTRGGVWVGTRRGLAHLQPSGIDVLTKADGLGGDLVGALLQSPNGDLWIATPGGLSRREPGGHITTFRLPGGPLFGVITSMAEAGGGHFWVGTSKGMVFRLLNDAFVLVFGSEARVPIDGMLADDQGFLWLRAQHGLDRLPVLGLGSHRFRCVWIDHPPRDTDLCESQAAHYGRADGLPSTEVTPGGAPLMTNAGGELWFATRRGVAIADPEHLAFNGAPPPMVIERFLADERPLSLDAEPIDLPFGPVRFTIEYAGLSYTAPSEVRYRYKLDGLDQDWTEAGGRRSATYTNLRPRAYTFRVQAMNNDGVWNEAGAKLRFRIVPPFYRRWWFVAVMILAAAALIAGAYRLRLRAVQARFNAVLGERNRMAREIHDTLAQDFVGVSLQLDIVSQLLRSQKVEAAAQQVGQTRKLVTDGLVEARRSIWELRANLAEDSLPTRLAKVVERYASERLAVRLGIGGAYRKLANTLEDEVLRVAQEALSNVQRHSGANEAAVDLHYGSDVLLLIVKDGGHGFVPAEVSRKEGHYGVRGMGERADAIGAKLTIDSSVDAGTKVTLLVPIPAGEVK